MSELKPYPYFGDYVCIEQYRYGSNNENYLYKVIGNLESNSWVDVPVKGVCKETYHEDIEVVVRAICCGVDETDVYNFRVSDLKPTWKKRAQQNPETCAQPDNVHKETEELHTPTPWIIDYYYPNVVKYFNIEAEEYDEVDLYDRENMEYIVQCVNSARDDGLKPIDTAPRDGTVIRLRLGEEMTILAKWSDGFIDGDEQPCGGWVAKNEGEHPPCWTDGCCWASNADDRPSLQPNAWMPHN